MHHGQVTQQELARTASRASTEAARDRGSAVPNFRFRPSFPALPPHQPSDEGLVELAASMREPTDAPVGDHPTLRAGDAFFGQFIDHDITFDALSRLGQDPVDRNFRSPAMDLDSLYGGGPDAGRHLYDVADPLSSGGRVPVRLLVPEARPWDVPRNEQGTALIGDPRNDENHFVSQLHRVFLGFHNYVVDQIASEHAGRPQDLFEAARRLTTQHYHEVVRTDFLPKIVDAAILKEVLAEPRFYAPRSAAEAFIPTEFAVAAFRFGHTLIRQRYRLNERKAVDLFDGEQVPPFAARDKTVSLDWAYFVGDAPQVQRARRIDGLVSASLFDLPFVDETTGGPRSLPERNLRRGRDAGLPSGQSLAQHLDLEPLSNDELGIGAIEGLRGEAPLWAYLLYESGRDAESNTLGPLGSLLVGEVLVGLMRVVPASPLNDPSWSPRFADDGVFDLARLVDLGRPDPARARA